MKLARPYEQNVANFGCVYRFADFVTAALFKNNGELSSVVPMRRKYGRNVVLGERNSADVVIFYNLFFLNQAFLWEASPYGCGLCLEWQSSPDSSAQ